MTHTLITDPAEIVALAGKGKLVRYDPNCPVHDRTRHATVVDEDVLAALIADGSVQAEQIA